jgi:hypothetical protein
MPVLRAQVRRDFNEGGNMAAKKVLVAPAIKSEISKEKLLKEIEKKAYEIFLKRNGKDGNDLTDWLEAEKIVKKQYKV